MAATVSGFSKLVEREQKAVLQLPRARNFLNEVDDILNVLRQEGFVSEETGSSLEACDPVSYGRRIFVTTREPIQTQMVQGLNAVYDAESDLINELHDTTLVSVLQSSLIPLQQMEGTAPLPATDQMRIVRAAKWTVNKLTQDLVDHNDLINSTDSQRTTRRMWDVWAQAMLEDFFDVCSLPNDLEVMMLAQVTSSEHNDISDWFWHKRREHDKTNKIKETIANKGSARSRWRKEAYRQALAAESAGGSSQASQDATLLRRS